MGLALINAGHYETEYIVKDLLYERLTEQLEKISEEIDIVKSKINTNPWNYIDWNKALSWQKFSVVIYYKGKILLNIVVK